MKAYPVFFSVCISVFLLWIPIVHAQEATARKTDVTIEGDMFYINGRPTFEGRKWKGYKIEGLLPNSRMVQGIFDDLNPETASLWQYSDTRIWDPERNTSEFIEAMPLWYSYGLLSFTINLQGGSPKGYGNRDWYNSAFTEDGQLREDYFARLERILDRADELGMVPIVGVFYFGQDQNLRDETAVKTALINTVDWLLDKGYTNLLIEVANECDNANYDHAIIKADRIHELITLVKSREKDGHRLLAGTSFNGTSIPVDDVLEVSDFVLLHGNGVKSPDEITHMVKKTRAMPGYHLMPIVFNEDDHFDFEKKMNNFVAATQAYASWGYFDYRMKDESFEQGYQSVPVDWGINSQRKKDFFILLKKITGGM